MSESGDFCDPEVLVTAEREDEARFLAVLEALEAAQEVAATNDFVNLAASLSALALMFHTGFDVQAWKALEFVSEPIRQALAECSFCDGAGTIGEHEVSDETI